MSGQPSHFEIGVPDTERARRFYGAVFGWEFDATEKGARVETGGIPGGLHGSTAGSGIQIFYLVDDLDEAARRVKELGGEVDDAGEERAGERWAYSCRDDQGVPFGLHERAAG